MIELFLFCAVASAFALSGLGTPESITGEGENREEKDDSDESQDQSVDCIIGCVAAGGDHPSSTGYLSREDGCASDDLCDDASLEDEAICSVLAGVHFSLRLAPDVSPIDGGEIVYVNEEGDGEYFQPADSVVVRGIGEGNLGVVDAGLAKENLVVEAGDVGDLDDDCTFATSWKEATIIGFRPEDQDFLVLFHDSLLVDNEENGVAISHSDFEASVETVGSGSRVNLIVRGVVHDFSDGETAEVSFVSARSIDFPDVSGERFSKFLLVARDPSGLFLPIGEFFRPEGQD